MRGVDQPQATSNFPGWEGPDQLSNRKTIDMNDEVKEMYM
jgi:hypothetical protein